MVVRLLVHSLGYRYRLHDKKLPGKPDLVFPRLKKVIFVHGCFWHRHPKMSCKLTRTPKSKVGFWNEKFRKNQLNDRQVQTAIKELGWESMVIWECEIRDDEYLTDKLKHYLGV